MAGTSLAMTAERQFNMTGTVLAARRRLLQYVRVIPFDYALRFCRGIAHMCPSGTLAREFASSARKVDAVCVCMNRLFDPKSYGNPFGISTIHKPTVSVRKLSAERAFGSVHCHGGVEMRP
jgi:hypothetical protein